jgi:hypothetical protein
MDNEALKQYGIVLKDTRILTLVYSKYESLVSLPISDTKMLGIDLSLLPNKPLPFKEVLIKWLLMSRHGCLASSTKTVMASRTGTWLRQD